MKHGRRIHGRGWAVLLVLAAALPAQEPFATFAGDVSANVSLSLAAQQTKFGDPIYPVNGEVKIDKVDFSVPAVGFPFVFSRHYRSMATYDGPLGHRWDFAFNARVVLEDHTLLSYDGSCRVDAYTWNTANARWEAPGRYDYFGAYAAQTAKFTRVEKSGVTYEYDAHISGGVTKGRLSAIKDPNGNTMTVSFVTAIATDPDAKISKVTDAQGREYVFTYNSTSQLLETVADYGSTPRKIKFEYDAYADLTKVTELPGETLARVTTYAYNSATASAPYQHLLVTITDQKQNASSTTPVPFCRNYYDSTGVCFAQEYGPGAASADTGTPSPAYTLSMSAPSVNPRTTTVTDRAGSTIKYYFSSANLVTKKEWLHGSHPTWEYSYDADYNLTTIIKPLGAKEVFTYDSDGNLLTHRTQDSANANVLTQAYEYDPALYHVLTKATDPRGVQDTYAYDVRGNLTSHVHDAGGGGLALTTTYTYLSGSRYLLDQVTDPRGKITDYGYDGDYRLSTVTADAGSGGLAIVTATFSYDAFGNVTAIQDGNGRTTTYEVNRLNQVVKQTAPSPLAYEEKYYYDASDNLTKTETQNGASDWFVVVMAYDLLDNLTTRTEDVTSSTTRTTTFAYDQEDRVTLVTSPVGDQVKAVYDDFGLRSQLTVGYGSSDAATTKYTYDDDFRLTKVEEPKSTSHVTRFYYDHHDRLTKTENALGHYAVTAFGSDHLPDSTTSYSSANAVLAQTTLAYDGANRLTTTERKIYTASNAAVGDGWITTTFAYDAAGNVTATTDENGHATTCAFDGLNRPTLCIDPIGSQISYVYDAVGNVLTKKEEEKQQGVSGFDTYLWRYEYDALDRLTKAYDPASAASLFTFDYRSNLVTTENPLGKKAFYTYDELGRQLTARVQYSGTNELTTRTTYDANDRVTAVYDANSNATTYAYDELGRCHTQTFADSGTRTFVYDANSNVVTTTDPNGTVVVAAYDLVNRLTGRTFSLATDVRGEDTAETFAYDALNRLTSAGDSDALSLFTYNTAGLVETEEQRVGAGNLTTTGKIVAWTYDDQGRTTALLYPGATTTDGRLNYAFDDANRLTKVTRQLTSTTTQDLSEWTFKGGRVLKRQNGNGTWHDVAYDARKAVTSIEHQRLDSSTTEAVLTATYGYDAAGHQTTEGLEFFDDKGDVLEDKGFKFHYDAAYRLTKLYRDVPVAELGNNPPGDYSEKVEYALDAAGNRQTVARTPYGGSATYDVYTVNSTNAYTTVVFNGDSETYDYDVAGNRTTANSKVWYFDYANRLVEVDIENSTHHSAYAYDALGRRVEKAFEYDGLEYEVRKRYFYAGGTLIQEYDVTLDGSTETVALEVEYFWGLSGAEPIYIRQYDALASPPTLEQEGFYHQNLQGSVYAITGVDAAANLVETYRYTEFGELTAIYDGEKLDGIPQSFGNKWHHQCHYYDAEVTYLVSGQALYGGDRAHSFDPEQNTRISRNESRSNLSVGNSCDADPLLRDAPNGVGGGALAQGSLGVPSERASLPTGGGGKGSDPECTFTIWWWTVKWIGCLNSVPFAYRISKTECGGIAISFRLNVKLTRHGKSFKMRLSAILGLDFLDSNDVDWQHGIWFDFAAGADLQAALEKMLGGSIGEVGIDRMLGAFDRALNGYGNAYKWASRHGGIKCVELGYQNLEQGPEALRWIQHTMVIVSANDGAMVTMELLQRDGANHGGKAWSIDTNFYESEESFLAANSAEPPIAREAVGNANGLRAIAAGAFFEGLIGGLVMLHTSAWSKNYQSSFGMPSGLLDVACVTDCQAVAGAIIRLSGGKSQFQHPGLLGMNRRIKIGVLSVQSNNIFAASPVYSY